MAKATTTADQKPAEPRHSGSKYVRTITGVGGGTARIDVYDVCEAFNVKDAPITHAIKKLLLPGQRGGKDRLTDLEEARDAIERAIRIEKQRRAD